MIHSENIFDFLNLKYQSKQNFRIDQVKSVFDLKDPDECVLTYIYIPKIELLQVFENLSPNILVIVPLEFEEHCSKLKQSFIFSPEPKLDFIRVLNNFFLTQKQESGTIHPTALIDKAALIHPSVSIGAYSIIDACEIGEGSVIHQNVHVYSKVRIGKNVKIKSSCEIGTEDFGPVRQPNNEVILFPQIGSLIIDDDVEVFPFTAIGRGTLGITHIQKGVKIDHCCQIGHNTVIGKNTVITANSVVCGSSSIGENCHIGAQSVIRNEYKIGNNVLVGIGSVVTKSFGDNLVIAGNPARILRNNNPPC
jgi:UDP-3-O-[3-hydroxymyristoyl] glucosamine N-acyltransferase